MFFNNLIVYRTPSNWISLEALADQLGRAPFVSRPANQPSSRGFIPVRGSIVHAVGRQWMIALQTEEAILPASVLADAVKKKVDALTEQQGYTPGRKQIKEVKERTIEEMLPQAFSRRSVTYVWIDPVAGFFCVNASGASKVEAVIEAMRQCLDEFPLAMLHTQISPQSAMADWLAGEGPDGFSIDRDCQFKAASEEKATITYQHHPLEGMTEIRDQLAKGLLPTKLALTFDDRLSFVLNEKFELKRLTFLDLLKEEAEQNAETADDQFDADFALMTGELGRLLPNLIDALGGEVVNE